MLKLATTEKGLELRSLKYYNPDAMEWESPYPEYRYNYGKRTVCKDDPDCDLEQKEIVTKIEYDSFESLSGL